MKNTTRAAAVAGVALAATAVAASTNRYSSGGVFVQTTSPDGNKVVAYDGKLHQVAGYSTGGRGGVLTGAVVDPLASQGLARAGPRPRPAVRGQRGQQLADRLRGA